MESNIDIVALLNKAYESGISVFEEEQKLKFKVAKNKKVDPQIVDLLKSNKAEILVFLNDNIDGRIAPPTAVAAIDPKQRNLWQRLPLSFAQERLWFVDQLEGSTGYHLSSILRLRKQLDRNLLELALRDLVERHEALRTVFQEEEGQAYQRVQTAQNWQLDYQELSRPSVEQEQQLMKALVFQAFDLRTDYLLRAHLIRCAPEEHLLILVMHHIAADGWSISILVNDLIELYRARQQKVQAALPELPIQYADYAIWQRTQSEELDLAKQLDWWTAQLADTELLELPADFPRPNQGHQSGRSIGFELGQALSDALEVLAQKEQSTLFMTLLAAWNILFYRYTGQKDICIGSPLANRDQAGTEGLIGLFLNTLTLRNHVQAEESFVQFLNRVKANTLAAFAHQDVPFEQIVDRVAADRRQLRNPLFRVVFTFQNTPPTPNLELGDLSISQELLTEQVALLDIWIAISQTNEGYYVKIIYSNELFSAERMEQMAQHFKRLLQAIVQNPEQAIGTLSLFPKRVETQILEQFNQPLTDEPATHLVALFDEKAQQYPEHPALLFDNRVIHYADLQQKANALARYLLQHHEL
ncbi:MAG: condensation domain-containing protein, partial [Bacteroidota bacterium]